MAKTDQEAIAVCDAGPLIHLDELESLDLLSDFAVWVPDTVWREVGSHRSVALQHPAVSYERFVLTHPISPTLTVLGTALLLAAGEMEALATMADVPNALFLTDDSAARLAAEQFGYRVHGSIGILLRAIRQGKRTSTEVVALLEGIPLKSSLHIRPGLLAEIIAEVKASHHLE